MIILEGYGTNLVVYVGVALYWKKSLILDQSTFWYTSKTYFWVDLDLSFCVV